MHRWNHFRALHAVGHEKCGARSASLPHCMGRLASRLPKQLLRREQLFNHVIFETEYGAPSRDGVLAGAAVSAHCRAGWNRPCIGKKSRDTACIVRVEKRKRKECEVKCCVQKRIS